MKLLHAMAFCGVILVGAEQIVGPRGGGGVLPGSAGKLAAGLAREASEAEPRDAGADRALVGAGIESGIEDAAAALAPALTLDPAPALAPPLGAAGLPVSAPRTELVEAPGRV